MKDFGDWFAEQGKRQQVYLPEGTFMRDGKVFAVCRSCERDYELGYDVDEGFDPDMSYCGGSPRCLP